MNKTNNIILFSGSSNPQLAKKISKDLSIEEGKINLKKFANGETYIQFTDNIRGKDIFLLQTATEPINDNLMELLIMIDAAKRASAGRIVAVIPNFFYARQDRKTASREPITARLIADLLTTAGADRIITIDLHSDQTQGFFHIPLDNLPTTKIMIEKAKTLINGQGIVVAPDAGSVKRATVIASKMNLELAIVNKMRHEHNKVKALNIIGSDIKNKNCLIFDDMVDTGGSLCATVDILKDNGAKKVYALITHGVLSNDAVDKIEKSKIDKLFITDSLPLREKNSKIQIISIAEYISDAIKCIHEDESISVLWED